MADDTNKQEEETSEATEESSAAIEETSEATEETSEATEEETSEAEEETSETEEETSEAEEETSETEEETSETEEETSEAGDSEEASSDDAGDSDDEADATDEADEDSDSDDVDEDDTVDIAGDGIHAGRKRPAMPVEQADLEDEDEAQRDWSEAEDEADDKETELVLEEEKVTGGEVAGIAAYFDHPDHLLYAASETRESKYEGFEAYSPFPIHGMDDAMGLGRSWIPWVTFVAGCAGLLTATGLQFGIMGFDWPMIYGGKPFNAWPSFVPIMFELTVLFAGVTTGLVMLKAAGCFQKPFIVDKEITKDRFVLWISAEDEYFKQNDVIEFVKGLNPSEIRTVRKDG